MFWTIIAIVEIKILKGYAFSLSHPILPQPQLREFYFYVTHTVIITEFCVKVQKALDW